MKQPPLLLALHCLFNLKGDGGFTVSHVVATLAWFWS